MSSLRVTYELPSARKRETVTVTELSLGGLFLETTEKPSKGSFVSVEIESGTTRVVVDGRVLEVRTDGFAVGFIDLPNDVASTLSFILSTRLPQRGTQLGLGAPEEGVPGHKSAPRIGMSELATPIEDSYAPPEPRHPTPRMMPVAQPSSSNAFPPVAVGPPSSGTLPAPGPRPRSSTSLVVWILVPLLLLAIVVVLAAAAVIYFTAR